MHFCNKCDKSFTRKDNLVRHHRKYHDDEASFSSLLRSLGYSSKAASYEPKQKRARTNNSESSEENEMNDETEVNDESEIDGESIAPASSSDGESDHDDLNDEEDIEEELNDEDKSTPSLYPLRNVWDLIEEDAEKCYDGNVVNAYIDQVRLGRKLKNDPVHLKVMETMRSLQERDLDMDFDEALVKAANRRKHIIEQATTNAADETDTAERETKKPL